MLTSYIHRHRSKLHEEYSQEIDKNTETYIHTFFLLPIMIINMCHYWHTFNSTQFTSNGIEMLSVNNETLILLICSKIILYLLSTARTNTNTKSIESGGGTKKIAHFILQLCQTLIL